MAGWGKDAQDGSFQVVQNKVDIPIMNRQECGARIRQAFDKQGNFGGSNTFTLSKSEICAGGEEEKDACDGDGGAPLVCLSKENRWHVVGLVTWGIGCGKVGVPGVYANIYQMIDFIMAA